MIIGTSSSLQATLQRPHRPFKDLDQLARLGQIRRHYGGISSSSSSQNSGQTKQPDPKDPDHNDPSHNGRRA